MVNENELLSAAERFELRGAPVSVEPLGNGHINQTCLLIDARGNKYVLQRINQNVFKDTDTLMNNILSVTEYLNGIKPGSSLNFIKTKDGAGYLKSESGCYRVYDYVEGISLEKASSPAELGTCGLAFGGFQTELKGFDASLLGETIPRFHDTVKRVNDLEEAALRDELGRLKTVKNEYEFYISRKGEASRMLSMQAEGKIKTRVTHNDTKLNNVILDPQTLSPVCVIDLDTVMPGLAGNDFGDCIRSGATTGREDEPDLSKVSLDLNLYRAFAEGFIAGCAGALNECEIETLPLGAYLMTYECGARFLTDYLNGDVYFHTDYEAHNLIRTRTQMKLVRDTEDRQGEIKAIIDEISNREVK